MKNETEITVKPEEECFINSQLSKKDDKGFMGHTHALSGVAIFLVLITFWNSFLIKIFNTNNIWVLILSLFIISGAALIPDLDNTKSTSKSSLGLLGDLLSLLFRGSSVVIQTTIKTKYDNSEPNPHRGFWHTTLSCIILGLITFGITKINVGSITIPYIGELNYAGLFALLISWLNVHLCLAGLINGTIKKIKKKAGFFGDVVSFILSFTLTFFIFIQIPKNISFEWLGLSVFIGCLIHILGDTFTTMGDPLFFPIPIKGKLWYNIRILPIHAGGVIENYLFIPIFLIIIILCILKIIHIF